MDENLLIDSHELLKKDYAALKAECESVASVLQHHAKLGEVGDSLGDTVQQAIAAANLPLSADNKPVDIFANTPPPLVWNADDDGKPHQRMVVGWAAGAWEEGPTFLLAYERGEELWELTSSCYSTEAATREAAAAKDAPGETP